MTPDRAQSSTDATPKVIGLGAPISVRISFEIAEIPALIDAIDDQLGRYGAPPQRNDRGRGPARDPHAVEWSDHIGELRRMRAHMEHAAAHGPERFDVVWPTVLAHDVVHGAVGHAERCAAAADAVDGAAARDALAAAQRTLRDFRAVDDGGLDAVWL
jgi:hypothetical protein